MKIFVVLALVFSLFGCSSPSVDNYAGTKPEFNLRDFFDGKLTAHGTVQDRQGNLLRRFTATIDATWQGNTLTLDEDFIFDDGELQKRVWTVIDLGDGRYSGTAGDVIGTAQGVARGAVFHWQYDLAITVDDADWVITLDDWMYLIDENTVINKTEMLKWGFKVGDITLVIAKNKLSGI